MGAALAVLALAAGGATLQLANRPSEPVGDLPAMYPDRAATRVRSFTIERPPNDLKPGVREWTRVAPDRWRERYEDGTEVFFHLVSRIYADPCDGLVVSQPIDPDFQVFIPESYWPYMILRVRRLSEGLAWTDFAEMNDVD